MISGQLRIANAVDDNSTEGLGLPSILRKNRIIKPWEQTTRVILDARSGGAPVPVSPITATAAGIAVTIRAMSGTSRCPSRVVPDVRATRRS
ncbi:MAG: hypothetical protein IAE87_16395 [Rhodobacteraceae bacterium]|jgi:hypothetical protein|nr:hypothetical protein [Paracoccaceae bacterium]